MMKQRQVVRVSQGDTAKATFWTPLDKPKPCSLRARKSGSPVPLHTIPGSPLTKPHSRQKEIWPTSSTMFSFFLQNHKPTDQLQMEIQIHTLVTERLKTFPWGVWGQLYLKACCIRSEI